MKMMYGSVPVTNLHITKHDVSTDDATLKASDLQSGVTAYARGQKVTGTGKAFAFALYGGISSNDVIPIPVAEINTISIASASYSVKMESPILVIRDYDYSVSTKVADVTVDGTDYPIAVMVTNNTITVTCEKTVALQVLFGKDEYTT